MVMAGYARWVMAAAVVGLLAAGPLAFYRYVYTHGKRLRVVTPGRVYRSGQMTEAGFAEAVRLYQIRTVVNVQDDYPDPDVHQGWLLGGTVKESELCRRLGVRFVFLAPDLIPRRQVPERRPAVIEDFLRLMDDPASYPVLIHCKAGLHRTGALVAVYRMEYEGYTPRRALREMLDNGFGRTGGTEANDYIKQYVMTFRPGVRRPEARAGR